MDWRWLARVTVFLAASVLVIKYLLPYVLPFVLAAIFALAIDPLVSLLEVRLHIHRGWATILGLAIVLLAVGVLGAALVSQLVAELTTMAARAPDYAAWVVTEIQRIGAMVDRLLGEYAPAGIPAPVMYRLQQQLDAVGAALQGWANGLLTGMVRLPSGFMLVTVTVLATYFIIKDKRLVVSALLGFLPTNWRHGAAQIKTDLWVTAAGYVRAELILIVFTITIATAGLVVLRARFAILLGLLAGLLDLLPVVGPAMLFVPWAIYSMLAGSVSFGIGLFITLLVMFTVRQLLEPRLLAGQLGLHPLITLMAIWLGLQVFGTWGLVIGPFLAVLVRSLVRANIIPLRRA